MTAARTAARNLTRLLCRTEITLKQLSCSRKYTVPAVNPAAAAQYNAVFPDVIDAMVASGTFGKYSPETKFSRAHFRKALYYNTQHYLKEPDSARVGVWLVDCYKHLKPEASEKQLKSIRMLAWLCEIWPRSLIIADDVVQDRRVRDKQPSWHTQIKVGLMALHDAVLVENSITEVINGEFRQTQHCNEMMELLHESAVYLITGQEVHLKTSYDQFCQTQLDQISKLMSGTVSQLPLRLTLYAAGISDESEHKNIEEIGLSFGQWYQEQDDVTNCYGHADEVGSFISENRCTWLIVRALEKADVHQKQILQDNYGQKNSDSVNKVLDVYNQLNLLKDAKEHDRTRYEGVMSLINNYSGVFSQTLLTDHADFMLNRKYTT